MGWKDTIEPIEVEQQQEPRSWRDTIQSVPEQDVSTSGWRSTIQTAEAPDESILAKAIDFISGTEKASRAELEKSKQDIKNKEMLDYLNNQVASIDTRSKDAGLMAAAALAALDSAAFGLTDEAEAIARTISDKIKGLEKDLPEDQRTGFWDIYRVYRDALRTEQEEIKEKHPTASAVGSIGGLFVPGAAMAKGVKGLGKAAQIAIDLGVGGVWALGTSEADVTRGEIGQIAIDVAKDAALASGLMVIGRGITAGKDIVKQNATDLVEGMLKRTDSNTMDRALETMTKHSVDNNTVRNFIIGGDEQAIEVLKGGSKQEIPKDVKDAIRNRLVNERGKPADKITDSIIRTELRKDALKLGSSLTAKQYADPEAALRAINKTAKTGKGHVIKAYNNIRYIDTILDSTKEFKVPELSTFQKSIKYVADWIIQSTDQANFIDILHSTELGPHLLRMGEKGRYFKFLQDEYAPKLKEMEKAINKSKLSSEKIIEIIEQPVDVLDAWKKTASDVDKAAVESVQTYYADSLELLRKLGLRVGDYAKRTGIGYIPRTLKRSEDLMKDIRAYNKKFSGMYDLNEVEFKQALKDDQEFADFVKGIGQLKDRNIGTGAGLDEAVKEILGNASEFRGSVITKASSTMMRDGEPMANWLRDKDLMRIGSGYFNSMFRHALLRDDLQTLNQYARLFKARKDRSAAEYVDNLARTISGTKLSQQEKIAIGFRNTMDKMIEAAEEDGKTVAPILYKAIRNAPAAFNYGMQQLYPYWLGSDPFKMGRNLTQPYLLTIPHLAQAGEGTQLYASKLALGSGIRSVPESIKYMKDGVLGRKVSRLHELGLAPGKHTPEIYEWVRDGLREAGTARGLVGKKLDDFIKTHNDIVMSGYQWSDIHNRLTTVLMSDRWGDDVLEAFTKRGKGITEDERAALTMFEKVVEPGHRQALMRRIKQGKRADFKKELARYLVDKTQFSYDRITMNKLGREVGGIFAMFSKWPSAIAGDIYVTLSRQDLTALDKFKRTGIKYLSPLAFMTTAGVIASRAYEDPDKFNFISAAPIASIAGLVSGQFASPPAVDYLSALGKAAYNIPNDALRGKSTKRELKKLGDKVIFPLIPGMSGLGAAGAITDSFNIGHSADVWKSLGEYYEVMK